MKNLFIVTLTLLLISAITSCQKEIVLNNPAADTTGGSVVPPGTNGELVIKVYGKAPSGADSNVSYYTYNSMKKVVSRHIMINAYGQSTDTWDWYERNAAGLIVRSKQYQVNSASPLPSDTSVTNHYYSSGSSPMLLSSVSSASFFGISITDSVAYSYNSAGRPIKSEQFQSGFLSPTPDLSSRAVYSYNAASNPSKLEEYSIASGVATLASTQTYTYDTKTEPLHYSEAESLIIGELPAAKNNALSFVLTTTQSGGTNANISQVYTYNSAGKPATTVTTTVLTGPLAQTTVTKFTVYYQ